MILTHPRCATHMASAQRRLLLEVASAKRAAVGKNEKMEILSGIEFRQRVYAIVEAFVTMQEDLQEERRSTERRYAKKRFKGSSLIRPACTAIYKNWSGRRLQPSPPLLRVIDPAPRKSSITASGYPHRSQSPRTVTRGVAPGFPSALSSRASPAREDQRTGGRGEGAYDGRVRG